MRKIVACLALVFLSSFASSALAEQRFPIDADEYRQTITSRVEATWEKIEKKLDHHKVSDDRKQEIRGAFDEAVARIDQAIEKASADGQISRGEAFRINTMTSGLRGKLRGKLAVDKSADRTSDKSEPRPATRVTRKSAANKDEEFDSRSDARKPAPVRKQETRAPKKRATAKAPKAEKAEQS